MNYYTLPARLYDDTEELAVWLRRAISAARTGGDKRRKRRA
jgi:TfoX/Sxy family transcriptional regulator of competence genes